MSDQVVIPFKPEDRRHEAYKSEGQLPFIFEPFVEHYSGRGDVICLRVRYRQCILSKERLYDERLSNTCSCVWQRANTPFGINTLAEISIYDTNQLARFMRLHKESTMFSLVARAFARDVERLVPPKEAEDKQNTYLTMTTGYNMILLWLLNVGDTTIPRRILNSLVES